MWLLFFLHPELHLEKVWKNQNYQKSPYFGFWCSAWLQVRGYYLITLQIFLVYSVSQGTSSQPLSHSWYMTLTETSC